MEEFKRKLKGVLEDIDYDEPIIEYRAEKLSKTFMMLFREKVNPNVALDVFYTWYLPKPEVKRNIDEETLVYNKVIVETLMRAEDYNRLKYKTVVDIDTSFSYTIIFIKKLMDLLRRETSRSKERGKGAQGLASILSYLKGVENKPENVSKKDFEKLKELINEAHRRAKRTAENIKELKNLMGGESAGNKPGSFVFGEIMEDILRLASSAYVTEILKYIKGISKTPLVDIRRETYPFKHGVYDGIEMGKDVLRILPKELILSDDVFFKKFVDSQLLLRRRVLSREQGPIYVLLDKSGSMIGDKTFWARAIALALMKEALKHRRKFCLRFFDYLPYDIICVKKGSRTKEFHKLYRMLLSLVSGGGTWITGAILTACKDLIEERVEGTSSIVLITDGRDVIKERAVKKGLKDAKADLVTVMIKGSNESLKRISKKYYVVVSSKNYSLKIVSPE